MRPLERRALRAGCILATVLSIGAGRAARADEPTDPVVAVVAGGALATASLGIGAVSLASASSRSGKNAGLIGAQAGLTLTPILAHATLGWGEVPRGALFALIPLAGLATTSLLAATSPDFIAHGGPEVQWPAYVAIAVSVFGAGLGTLDVARDRGAPPVSLLPQAFRVTPWADPTRTREAAGALVEGAF
jgi:hypothetical protein